jgi:prepilin-type N-terminal cleavage/methylation domain-containing protein
MHINKKAFTLIELLVVVLIIGILAAIALPQYQKAIDKSNIARAFVLGKAALNASNVYNLVHGEYPCNGIMGGSHATLKNLDIDLQLDGNSYTKDGKYYVYYNNCKEIILQYRGLVQIRFFLDRPKIWCHVSGANNTRGHNLCKTLGGQLENNDGHNYYYNL